MPLKRSLAAVIRLVRRARGLSKDEFQGVIDPKHMFNIENARSSVTLDTLEELASVLEVDTLALLTVAASLDRGLTHEQLLEHLAAQGRKLDELGIRARWPSEFKNGDLLPMQAGRRTPNSKIRAIQACRARGLNQKQTALELGISTSTVSRNWTENIN